MATIFQNVRLFDGVKLWNSASVLVEGETISQVSDQAIPVPAGAKVIDCSGKTLLPGLIDAHVHAQTPALEQNIVFGVTTCLDMYSLPDWMLDLRKQAANNLDCADIRSASCGGTVLKGHPSMLIGKYFPRQFPTVASVEDVAPFVQARIDEGADYIKFIVDDGTALSHHGQPTLTADMARAFVTEAHKHGRMAICHALDHKAASLAVDAGVDGLIHVFYDVPRADEVVAKIAKAGIWVTSTIVTLGALAGELTGDNIIKDTRAMELVPDALHANLTCCWGAKREPASTENAIAITRALHKAGVPILCGTDACGILGLGAVYGVGLHSEMRFLVEAGLSPIEALQAATSTPADKFGLTDRGRVQAGLKADLVLVNGDPTQRIEDAIAVDAVWRCGQRLDREKTLAIVQDFVAKKSEAAKKS